MNCTHHNGNQVSMICLAPHKCYYQRRLCAVCFYEHEVKKKQTAPIEIFQGMVLQKLKELKVNDSSELTTQRMNFKEMVTSTQKKIKQIWDELAESIKQIYEVVEIEDKFYLNFINGNVNPIELSYTDLDKLVQIIIGKTLDVTDNQKKSYLEQLELTKKYWQETQALYQKFNTELMDVLQFIKKKVTNQQENIQLLKEIKQVYNGKCKWKNMKHELNKLDGHSSCVNSVCFSPDGTTLASGSGNSPFIYNSKKSLDNSIRLWNVKTGQQKAMLDGHSDSVLSVCFSPDGTTLASGSEDKSICLWDVKTGQQNAKLDGHSDYVRSVCFSPDGTKLASGSDDNSIRLWDVKTGQQKAKLDGHSNDVNTVCFSPDGTTLASGSGNVNSLIQGDNSIRLWDVKTGQQNAKLEGHSSYVRSVCFSPDGTKLASGSDDNSIRLWDVKTGQLTAKLDGHSSQVYSVCFSPDGTTLASGSGNVNSLIQGDNSIRLWDVKTGEQKAQLDGHSESIWSVCFSPDSTTLASGSYDSIRLWDVETGQQILLSHNRHIEISAQSKLPIFPNNILSGSANSNITILQISQNPTLEAQGALILKGEFINYQGIDLRSQFKSKGSCFLESQIDQN
ncbi:unnamed protein product [Paramecium octaurelia]|uniref:CAF1B/HIR1 beta-propeller domain-containing protein n=1 Tax=Paramecium octaurelia TaxID=43137 RepID=A0A8S1XR27_PAROT|nr:unnamed protein product [Paramecium octaurelia]